MTVTDTARKEVVDRLTQIISRLNSYADGLETEIADLKDSNARLADALAAAKVRAGDTWNMDS